MNASAILQQLIRYDTTNPPGNEAEAILYLKGLLEGAGLEVQLLALDPARPNLLARLPGSGTASPLLLYGHVDVVTTATQEWKHPPFAGVIEDGYIWGRGALDMKCGLAMMVSALLRLRAEGIQPAGDILFLALSDEEAGGTYGAHFMVEKHAGLFQGVQSAIGEFGGFSSVIGNKKFYPIQVGEKQVCWLKASIRGPAGHGSIPVQGGAMAKLGRFLTRLDRRRLPIHITPITAQMIQSIAAELPSPMNQLLRGLLRPAAAPFLLNTLGPKLSSFAPLLSHTCSPTMLSGSDKINVIPAQISVGLDGRLLPGYRPEDLIAELKAISGPEIEFEVMEYDPGPPQSNLPLFELLAAILKDADPQGSPIPLLMPGVTDARFLARLGIQSYGFLPLNLPPGFNFIQTIHAADERVPVSALDFGTAAMFDLLKRYH
jgi:acetylornithine deacetylase/succinyl-diaminopimelate desuccinylase-like protein